MLRNPEDSEAAGSTPQPDEWRPDIEGLRALAIVLIVFGHAGASLIGGGFAGVHVFFVCSGFLVTVSLMRQLEARGRTGLTTFYARRAKRVLPAAGIVLLVTSLLAWWAVAETQLRTIGLDILASATFVANWVFAGRRGDHSVPSEEVSPVQHFWALAVGGQFYILWPLFLLVIVFCSSRIRVEQRRRALVILAIAVVTIGSFAYSIALTASDPNVAFFVTPTRLWEFGLGALVGASGTLWRRLPRRAAAIAGWLGVAMVVISGVIFTAANPWPGYAAALPAAGAALVILAGSASPTMGVGRALSIRPLVWIGGLSYSWYLWHWPLLVLGTYRWGELTTARSLLITVVSFILAGLTYGLLEEPLRSVKSMRRSNSLALSVGANFSLASVTAGLVLILSVPISSTSTPEGGQAEGAAALDDSGGGARGGTIESLEEVEWFIPAPEDATKSIPESYDTGCQQNQQDSDLSRCDWGPEDGQATIAVVGDSKMVQWESALVDIAEKHDWTLQGYIKSACGFSAGYLLLDDGSPYTSCVDWNAAVLQELIETQPDAVLVSSRAPQALADPEDPDSLSSEAMVEALSMQWEALRVAGIPVIVLLDNPSPGMSVYECVAENPEHLEECSFDKEEGIAASAAPAQRAAAQEVAGAQVIDLTESICPEDQCVPIIGNILLYRQGSHLTDEYVKALSSGLEEQLVPAVEEITGATGR